MFPGCTWSPFSLCPCVCVPLCLLVNVFALSWILVLLCTFFLWFLTWTERSVLHSPGLFVSLALSTPPINCLIRDLSWSFRLIRKHLPYLEALYVYIHTWHLTGIFAILWKIKYTHDFVACRTTFSCNNLKHHFWMISVFKEFRPTLLYNGPKQHWLLRSGLSDCDAHVLWHQSISVCTVMNHKM